MIWLGAIGALFALWLLGALVLAAAGIRPRGGVEALVHDFAAGAAVLALVGTAWLLVVPRLSVVPIYVVAAAAGAAVLLRRREFRFDLRPPRDRITAGLLGAAALVVLISLGASTRDRLWWDGWAIWAMKARVLFLDGTLPAWFLDSEGAYAFTHPGYPWAVPLVDWWIFRHAGAPVPALASFVGAFWFALLPAAVWGAARRCTAERTAALAALGTAVFWPIAFHAAGGAADVVIALVLLGAVVNLVDGIEGGEPAALWRAAIFLTLGALAKNEGLAIAAAAVTGGIAAARRSERRPAPRLPFAVPLLIGAAWQGMVRLRGLGEAVVSLSLAPGDVLARVPILVGALARTALTPAWSPLALLVPVGVAAAARERRWTGAAGWMLLATYIGTLGAVYLLTPHDLEWLIATSLRRVLAPLAPALVYLAVRAADTGGDDPVPVVEPPATARRPGMSGMSGMSGMAGVPAGSEGGHGAEA